ncbi:MAG: sulfatase-like hydrolase/transferase, partial [Pirellulales bacterium]|nr:sulfatase-like hydrolase/transferase [Pirellulales bacterium]
DAHLPFWRQQHGLPQEPLDANDVLPLPWIGLDTSGLRQHQADYYNCLQRMDTGIGMLLSALDQAGATERTLVIYLGDHGAQFPRGKLACYESSLRTPLIVRWPGKIAPGQVQRELVSAVDLVPTLLEAIGLKSLEGLPGRSLLPLVGGAAGETADLSPWREYLFTEYHGHYPPLYFPQRTVRDDRYKLIVNLLQDRPNPVATVCTSAMHPSYVTAKDVAAGTASTRRAYATWQDPPRIELYDLANDPHEYVNLAEDAEHGPVKERLLQELRAWQVRTRDPLIDPDKLARLTAEHDALPKPYERQADFSWKYPEYLHPGDLAGE